MNKIWHDRAWAEYIEWQTKDKRVLWRINKLLDDIDRNGYSGIGKPEPLHDNLSGWWSVRIDDKNRLIFRLTDGMLALLQCGSHYGDK